MEIPGWDGLVHKHEVRTCGNGAAINFQNNAVTNKVFREKQLAIAIQPHKTTGRFKLEWNPSLPPSPNHTVRICASWPSHVRLMVDYLYAAS